MSSTDAAASDSSLDILINAALHRLEAANPNGWAWLEREVQFTLSQGDASKTFAQIDPSNTIAKIVGIWVIQGQARHEVQRLSRDEQLLRYPSEVERLPETWAVSGETVWFRPVPNGSYTMWAKTVIAEPDLSGSASPLMPARFHDAIVEQAAYLLFRRLQNLTDAEAAQMEVQGWVRAMFGAEREYRGAGRVTGIARRWGDYGA